jgi:hypothetical protein
VRLERESAKLNTRDAAACAVAPAAASWVNRSPHGLTGTSNGYFRFSRHVLAVIRVHLTDVIYVHALAVTVARSGGSIPSALGIEFRLVALKVSGPYIVAKLRRTLGRSYASGSRRNARAVGPRFNVWAIR